MKIATVRNNRSKLMNWLSRDMKYSRIKLFKNFRIRLPKLLNKEFKYSNNKRTTNLSNSSTKNICSPASIIAISFWLFFMPNIKRMLT